MTVSAKFSKNKGLALLTGLFIGLISLTSLQGCSSSSKTPAAIADQVASGLFKSGTAELNSGATMLNDLRAFVHEGRIIMFSVAGHLLFDGQVGTITGDDYTATVDVYEAGVKTQSAVAVTGKVTSQSQITGTIAGTGNASGTFTLTFDTLYSRGATFARIDTDLSQFIGNIYNSVPGVGTNNFDFSSATTYDFQAFTFPSSDRCNSSGTYTMESDINIYSLNETITQADPDPACTMSETPVYTGFASVIDGSSTDDTLLYAVSNGTNAQFAILTH